MLFQYGDEIFHFQPQETARSSAARRTRSRGIPDIFSDGKRIAFTRTTTYGDRSRCEYGHTAHDERFPTVYSNGVLDWSTRGALHAGRAARSGGRRIASDSRFIASTRAPCRASHRGFLAHANTAEFQFSRFPEDAIARVRVGVGERRTGHDRVE